ncbi:MAG: SPOR domain-containing protein [Deltaproteobacteria bacterium]|jgi:cell division septation protein DedD|nr:SPOR domain-containing protein [Deltaproteobacteria bacterium]MBW2535464.1 SPOR domain-containing protein [Deltaproteobacteria bacterium]
MRRTSWWEETERFRDLDEIVERSPRGWVKRSRWVLIATVAAAAGVAGWMTTQRGNDEPSLPLGKFDQVLARHTPQRTDSATAEPVDGPTPRRAPPAQADDRAAPADPHHSADGYADDPSSEALADGELAAEPDEAAEAVGAGRYHIQVSSLRSKKRAELLAKRLEQEGHRTTVQTVGLRAGGFWHSVRIGPFDSRIQAEIYRLEFDLARGRETVVVPRSQGRYHVQVASLRSRAKAETLVKALRKRGHHARRKQAKRAGAGSWHMVRVGPFDTRAEAEAYRAHFTKREDQLAVVVPFEVSEPERGQTSPSLRDR